MNKPPLPNNCQGIAGRPPGNNCPPPGGTPSQPAPKPVPKPAPIQDPKKIVTDAHQVQPPAAGPKGEPITAAPAKTAPTQTTIVNKTVNNTTVINNIHQTNNYNDTDLVANTYYWHDYDGGRFCHYYDYYGNHWYGWYVGDSYFWTRYDYDRFWWYDPYWARWNYYRDGYWWWQDPGDVSVVYVYVNNNYYRYGNTGNGVVLQPANPAPAPAPQPDPSQPAPDPAPAPTPAPVPSDKFFYSDDGTRSVMITGQEKRAYLYDRTRTDAEGYDLFLKELAANVEDVEFSDPADGALQIVVTAVNGEGKKHVVAFDANGERLGAAGPAQPAAPQPPADGAQTGGTVQPPASTDQPVVAPAPPGSQDAQDAQSGDAASASPAAKPEGFRQKLKNFGEKVKDGLEDVFRGR